MCIVRTAEAGRASSQVEAGEGRGGAGPLCAPSPSSIHWVTCTHRHNRRAASAEVRRKARARRALLRGGAGHCACRAAFVAADGQIESAGSRTGFARRGAAGSPAGVTPVNAMIALKTHERDHLSPSPLVVQWSKIFVKSL